MLALQTQPKLMNIKQYENPLEQKNAAIFQGNIYDKFGPAQEHQEISIQLSTIFNTYIKAKKGSCKVFCAPFDV